MKNYLNTVTGIVLFTALLASLQTTASTTTDNADELQVRSQSRVITSEIAGSNTSAATSDIQSQKKTAEKTSPATSELFLDQVRVNSKNQAAEAAYDLSILAANRNDYALARKLIEESLQLNPSNPNYFALAAAIAFVTQEYDKAATYQMKVLDMARSEPGIDALKVAQILDQLGTIYYNQEDYVKAKSSFMESLQLREKKLGSNHLQVVVSLNKLASVAIHQDQANDAEALLKRSLNIVRNVSGPRHTNTATMLANLADFYHSAARLKEAEALYGEAISIWHESSVDPLTLAVCQNSLGQVLLRQKRFDDARLQFEQVLLLLKQNYTQDHPYVQQVIKTLSNLDAERKRNAESGALYDELVRELSARSQTHM